MRIMLAAVVLAVVAGIQKEAESMSRLVLNGHDIIKQRTQQIDANAKPGQSVYDIPDGKNRVRCLFINTVEENGKCVCVPGYWSDDPLRKGCWKCNETCHENAWCQLNGLCRCKKGFAGDGVNDCHFTAPEISDIVPTRCQERNCIVTITMADNKRVSSQAFCRFDTSIVLADTFDHTAITCRVPRFHRSVVKVAVSLDGIYWSEQEGNLGVVPVLPAEAIFIIVMIIFTVLCGVLCISLNKKTKNTVANNQEDQLIPILSGVGPRSVFSQLA